ncbi:Hypothetical predicted protein [Paramuricea clavata]|uniref:Uncharacterized protein n=1 Tax=Paramuricea clavata TaxID=317549 RepID=A0A7D9I078_PARCT|nr:Hypothetical predicted protein [Paramuricea clavata]
MARNLLQCSVSGTRIQRDTAQRTKCTSSSSFLCNYLGSIVQAFRAFGYSEVREYEILGEDFVIDLCSVTDVMRIVIDLMVKLQSLSCPCWKICVWFPYVNKFLEQLEHVSIASPPGSMKVLKANIKDIMEEQKFKDRNRVVAGVPQ